jgi:hypothetical protein
MDVNEHERLSYYTLRHKLKEQLVVRKDMDVNEHERVYSKIVSHVRLHPYPFLLQAVPLL